MCGILGTINKPFDKNVLELISHRGPDYSNIIHLKNDDKDIYFGHVRLSIQDLSRAGHQPMYSDD
jgi:asparagine synthase (glutamine-hydrolysing)